MVISLTDNDTGAPGPNTKVVQRTQPLAPFPHKEKVVLVVGLTTIELVLENTVVFPGLEFGHMVQV